MKKFDKDKIEEWMLMHQKAIGWASIIGALICFAALIIAHVI